MYPPHVPILGKFPFPWPMYVLMYHFPFASPLASPNHIKIYHIPDIHTNAEKEDVIQIVNLIPNSLKEDSIDKSVHKDYMFSLLCWDEKEEYRCLQASI